ncbi:MAG: ISKra4 family transposase [Planctomycetota bacterium]|nr:MAG: ISKra4 family transposase [Planctomycetota bacterium]
MVGDVDREGLTAPRFRSFLNGLGDLLASVGRQSLRETLELLDAPRTCIDHGGESLRYRERVSREWLTAMGKITVSRRTYRGDGPGATSLVPLDVACGMSGRFMTPDVEEMAAHAAAMVTPREVHQLLAKHLPEAPSTTAIQNAIRRIGATIAEHRESIEKVIDDEQPLAEDGDLLVTGWDGVMAPMRERGLAWREAGIATVSVYDTSDATPKKLDTRFLGRMPEKGMKSLLEDVADQVARASSRRSFRAIVAICDGKKSIWTAAKNHDVLTDAVWILDFYHASENLMKAANAIFGEGDQARQWHDRICTKLQLDDRGVENAIRSMRRYWRQMPSKRMREREARKVVENAIEYCRFHKDRMRYAHFLERGFPIGSGPVEAAAKNIVQARLKRSGMRWSRAGGQHVLDLRAYLKSQRWESMWKIVVEAA